jgi:outer membrane lipoprotein carrier protein
VNTSTPNETEPTKTEPAGPSGTGGTPKEASTKGDDATKESAPDDEQPAAALDDETRESTQLLLKAYRKASTFEADFEQTYRNRLLGRSRKSRGHVWLQPPTKMRWEYAPPSKNLIVADGRQLFVYEPDANQVVKMPVGRSELPAVMAFLTGGRELTRDYDVTPLARGREQLAQRGLTGLQLRPRSTSAGVARIVLVFDKRTGQIRRTVLVENEGNTNTFVWGNVKTQTPIAASRFAFTPPAGARIVER